VLSGLALHLVQGQYHEANARADDAAMGKIIDGT